MRTRVQPITLFNTQDPRSTTFIAWQAARNSRTVCRDRGRLPLADGEPPIAQSGAIMRYVSKLAGLAPANDLDAAKCDMIFEASQEVSTSHPNTS
eukprot:SAG31_NODE_55_length_29938_cov_9.154027_2_plen_95_part_00